MIDFSNAPIVRIALIAPTVIIIYCFWIRPILRSTPRLKELYDAEATWLGAFGSKFGGIKQKLAGSLISAACVIVELYDYVAPLISSSGIDTTPLTSHIPPAVWPLISIAIVLLLNYFRGLADRRNAADADAVQAAITTQPIAGEATPKAG